MTDRKFDNWGNEEGYLESEARKEAENHVAEFAGGRYEGIGADMYDYARREREKSPGASVEAIYERATWHLIADIRAYDDAVKESEEQKESQGYKMRL